MISNKFKVTHFVDVHIKIEWGKKSSMQLHQGPPHIHGMGGHKMQG